MRQGLLLAEEFGHVLAHIRPSERFFNLVVGEVDSDILKGYKEVALKLMNNRRKYLWQ